LRIRRDSGPIDSVARAKSFVSGRAAFVAQKTLYGYLRTRIGTRYPAMFEDDVFVHSVNIAKLHIFAACLSDLATYVAAKALDGSAAADATRRDLALDWFRAALADNADQYVAEFDPAAAEAAFAERLAVTDWRGPALRPDGFVASPQAMLRWAPIAPELKHDDVEIVENSIRFTWRDVREQVGKRLDAHAIAAELGA
jgi:hypothetical protein